MGPARHGNIGPSGARHAVTLVEVLVASSLLGLLVLLLAPSVFTARESARRTLCVAHLKHVGAAVVAYAFDNEGWGPAVMPTVGTTAPRSMFSIGGRKVNLARLLDTDDLARSESLFCPSQRVFASTSSSASPRSTAIYGSYAYAVQVAAGASPQLSRARHAPLASDDFVAPPGDDTGIGRHAHADGYNVLYADGGVSWYADPLEAIWRRVVRWDDETDDVGYRSFFRRGQLVASPPTSRGHDIFRVWHAFRTLEPEPF